MARIICNHNNHTRCPHRYRSTKCSECKLGEVFEISSESDISTIESVSVKKKTLSDIGDRLGFISYYSNILSARYKNTEIQDIKFGDNKDNDDYYEIEIVINKIIF